MGGGILILSNDEMNPFERALLKRVFILAAVIAQT